MIITPCFLEYWNRWLHKLLLRLNASFSILIRTMEEREREREREVF